MEGKAEKSQKGTAKRRIRARQKTKKEVERDKKGNETNNVEEAGERVKSAEMYPIQT